MDANTDGAGRARAPGLDALLGVKYPVLKDGYVMAVDYMGNDDAIVEAARTSYGKGTKKTSSPKRLIRRLMQDWHTGPFEMCELKLQLRVPMDAWRQWIRHRTGCLAAGTQLWFDLPGAARRNAHGRQRHNISIEDVHNHWHNGSTHAVRKKKPLFIDRVDHAKEYGVPALATLVERTDATIYALIRKGVLKATNENGRLCVSGAAWTSYASRTFDVRRDARRQIARMRLRCVDESTGEITHTRITDVWSTGEKPCFRVTLRNGYVVTMTRDHRCLTERGWMTMGEATGLSMSISKSVTWSSDAPAFATNGVELHLSQEWLSAKKLEGLGLRDIAAAANVSTHTIRKSLKRFGLQYTKEEKGRLSGAGQRGRKRQFVRHSLSPQGLAKVRLARSGEKSNFWKGGTTKERDRIGAWTTGHARSVHARHGYRCVICSGARDLNAHHADPVWHNQYRAYDESNLVTLCGACHGRVHSMNLELQFLAEFTAGNAMSFWSKYSDPAERHMEKRKPTVRRLARSFSQIANIEYVGESQTYDVSVEGPWHNFVANGFVVHNSVNEYSTRYSEAIDSADTTLPGEWRLQSANNKQGSDGFLSEDIGRSLSDAETAFQRHARATYEERLALGVAREQARKDLPLSTYTEAVWKIDLHNLLHFLRLRMAPDAQLEIRSYARIIGEKLVAAWVPHTWQAFLDFRKNAVTLSAIEYALLGALLRGETERARAIAVEAGYDTEKSSEATRAATQLRALGLVVPWKELT